MGVIIYACHLLDRFGYSLGFHRTLGKQILRPTLHGVQNPAKQRLNLPLSVALEASSKLQRKVTEYFRRKHHIPQIIYRRLRFPALDSPAARLRILRLRKQSVAPQHIAGRYSILNLRHKTLRLRRRMITVCCRQYRLLCLGRKSGKHLLHPRRSAIEYILIQYILQILHGILRKTAVRPEGAALLRVTDITVAVHPVQSLRTVLRHKLRKARLAVTGIIHQHSRKLTHVITHLARRMLRPDTLYASTLIILRSHLAKLDRAGVITLYLYRHCRSLKTTDIIRINPKLLGMIYQILFVDLTLFWELVIKQT